MKTNIIVIKNTTYNHRIVNTGFINDYDIKPVRKKNCKFKKFLEKYQLIVPICFSNISLLFRPIFTLNSAFSFVRE